MNPADTGSDDFPLAAEKVKSDVQWILKRYAPCTAAPDRSSPVAGEDGACLPAPRPRTARPKLGRPTGKDVVAGFVTGLFSIPEGMAYASIGGFNPVLGLYSGMAPTMVGAVFARTVLMTTPLTSAIALSSQSVLATAGLDPTDPGI
jgi:hypothetical protein